MEGLDSFPRRARWHYWTLEEDATCGLCGDVTQCVMVGVSKPIRVRCWTCFYQMLLKWLERDGTSASL